MRRARATSRHSPIAALPQLCQHPSRTRRRLDSIRKQVAEEKKAAETKRGGLKGGASAEVENKTHRQDRVMTGFHKWDLTTGIDTLLCVARPRA
eukprot:scaffold120802_cov69-Phaeocystis_antarctica.AAC.3